MVKVTNPTEIAFTVALQSVYSLTTTTGQHKGKKVAPIALGLPRENFFLLCPAARRYLRDFAGVFEVVRRDDGQGNALRQVVEHKGVEWQPDACRRHLSDSDLENYSVGVDAMIENAGFVSSLLRVASVHQNGHPETAYI